jgi:hypothetical protein
MHGCVLRPGKDSAGSGMCRRTFSGKTALPGRSTPYALCGWLSAKLMAANEDIEDLRKRVSHLKRRITLMR